jgi:exonuclease III
MKDEGLKSTLNDFRDLVKDTDVFCLQETKDPIKVAGFRCFNSNRKLSRSGGVCIGVKNDICKGVSTVNTSCSEDIIALRFKRGYFGMTKDIVFINVYDSPLNSSYKKKYADDSTILEKTSEVIHKLQSDTEVIVMGDFNARTGSQPDVIDAHFDPASTFQDEMDLVTKVTQRSNRDKKLNSNGKPFLEFVKNNGLLILNGRALGDVCGEMTCLKYNGCSVVDYMCASVNLYNNVRYMKVGAFSPLSDHYPINMSLRLGRLAVFGSVLPNFDDAPIAYKWKKDATADSSTAFAEAQKDAQIAMKINELIKSTPKSSDDVLKLSTNVTDLFNELASNSLSRKRHINTNKKKWYDWSCRAAKRELNKAAKLSGKHPTDENLRSKYHKLKKEYKCLIKSKKSEFLLGMNKKIENGKHFDWKAFKSLQEQHKDEEVFDTYDLNNFYVFFKDLYKKQCNKASHGMDSDDPPIKPSEDTLEALNSAFTFSEIECGIRKLKSNKGVSIDCISNEMLKHSNSDLRTIIQHLFNKCLEFGIYPWSNSITTPLHKKGNREDPDNYRAITLGSCLGKLFSSIVLERLVNFRRNECPDEPNQLGFCAGSQTSDHILTMKTLIDKYVHKKKQRLYTCFVDYKKAFDTVCRDALLYKLAHMGLSGNIFKCIQYMYQGSNTRIKLIKKISEAIEVGVGTEQGHPLSPELFKIFIHDLSVELNNLTSGIFPCLMDTTVNHLLWADDLVLMALDKDTLQRLLDILNRYVERWELEVNISKTNIMVFNTASKVLKESHDFYLGNKKLDPTRNYTYLGITFSLNGSFKVAVSQLTSKAARAYFQIKRTLDTRALSIKSLMILFDALIKPIIMYGCQVWLPYTNIGKSWRNLQSPMLDETNLILMSSKDCFERLHLKFLKWCLGVHAKASNLGCYGDTGRTPLGISVMRSSLKYFQRLAKMSATNKNSLVGKAYLEQQLLNLDWFTTWNSAGELLDDQTELKGQSLFEDLFVKEWNVNRHSQSKLSFYNQIKVDFGYEPYLDSKNTLNRKNLTRLRISAHDLKIEQGRYVNRCKGTVPSIADRICRYCYLHKDTRSHLDLLEVLHPNFNPILETEQHVLTECPGYHHLRSNLTDPLKSQLLLCDFMPIFYKPDLADELGSYLKKCFLLRNDNSKTKKASQPKGTKKKKIQPVN